MTVHAADTYAPDLRLEINGSAIPAELRATVRSVTYEDGRNAADRVEIVLANPDLYWLRSHIKGTGFSPYPTRVGVVPSLSAAVTHTGLLDVENTLSLSMGYASRLTHMFSGEITGIEASFPANDMPTLTVVAHDRLQRLARGATTRGFGLLPDFLIAMLLAGENLIIPLIDPTVIATSTAATALKAIFGGTGRKQVAKSDFDFLASIAKAYDADFWVEDDVLYLSRFIKEYTPSLALKWRQSLIEFAPRVSIVGQVVGVSMKFTLREIPLTFLVSVSWDVDNERLAIAVRPGAAGKNAPTVSKPFFDIVDQPISSPNDLANSAFRIIRELRNRLNTRMTGTGSAVGNPEIRAGRMIQLDDLGPDFSGRYRVKGATHSLDASGYHTRFEVFKELIP